MGVQALGLGLGTLIVSWRQAGDCHRPRFSRLFGFASRRHSSPASWRQAARCMTYGLAVTPNGLFRQFELDVRAWR